jgi:3-dehydroquinate synthase
MGRIEFRHAVNSGTAPYDVIIGEDILDLAAQSDAVRNADRRCIIVSKKVLSLHGDKIRGAFPSGLFDYLVMKDGEKQKSYSNVEPFLSKFLSAGLTRHSVIVAIGGGVVGDFAGFAASVYMRGIKIVQVPTTLLSMVDSSIGGKTAVNIGAGKNIAGAFHPPCLVAADTAFLETLPDDQWREGLSEAIKHAIIGEKELYTLFQKESFLSVKTPEVRSRMVSLAAGYKVGVVSRDEMENGERANLNFGHTVAHAIESAMRYKISHGAAVGIGMKIIALLCGRTGRISDDELRCILDLIDAYGIAPRIKIPSADELLDHMKYDKKNISGSIRFVLLEGLFRPIYNVAADAEEVRRTIRAYEGRD